MFTTSTNLLGPDQNAIQNSDVFLRDRVAGTTILISGTSDGSAQGTSPAGDSDSSRASIGITADGSVLVAFDSSASNLPGAPLDTNGHQDVFLRGIAGNEILNVSALLAGGAANGPSYDARLTPSAGHLVFTSQATNFGVPDTNGSVDVIWVDVNSSELRVASTNRTGVLGNFGGSNPDISADGRYVVFESRATNLVAMPNDSNAITKIFAKDMLTGDIEVVSRTASGAFNPDWSA